MGIEYELKFRCKKEQFQEILAEYPEENRHFDMVTTYYDTPSGALSARKYTLRRRMENGVSVCTLKIPAPKNGRQEMEISCEKIEDALKAFCCQVTDLAALVEEGLEACCGAKFHRIAVDIMYGDCQLELALDEGVLTGGGREIPLCEVEVELKSGPAAGADLFALEIANRYGLVTETKSKFRRALDLYKGA